MQIFVVNQIGKTLTLEVERDELVEQIKEKIKDKAGVPTDQQRLVFKGKELEEGKSLADYNVSKENTVHLLIRLKGC